MLEIGEGTTEVQLMVIARELGFNGFDAGRGGASGTTRASAQADGVAQPDGASTADGEDGQAA